MSLQKLFCELADVCDGVLAIEGRARVALRKASRGIPSTERRTSLPPDILEVLSAPDAHHVCKAIAGAPLPWTIPRTSDDPAYIANSQKKRIVELIGPDGLVPDRDLRVGLYGIGPGEDYGYRTHPAEEVFVMLAGEADWAKGDEGYKTLGPVARAHHPSMVCHATRTRRKAFMSLYVWCGDVSYEGYTYQRT